MFLLFFLNSKKWSVITIEKDGKFKAFYDYTNHEGNTLDYHQDWEKNPTIFRMRDKIIFSNAWMQMIRDNTASILGWIQSEKVRKLTNVRKLWDGILDLQPVKDVFTDKCVDVKTYDVDHFIPWSFVMNDELWNLMPMDSNMNSAKSNKLPDWDKFFVNFASNQYIIYDSARSQGYDLWEYSRILRKDNYV